MRREGFDVARCTVERLMRQLGIQGVVRGKSQKTTRPDKALPCPRDKVNRQFRAPAPNTLWVSDFTYVSTWQGFVYAAFVVDTYANRIVGWRASRSPQTQFVLDPWNRLSTSGDRLVTSSITATGAASTCRSATPSAWPKPGSNPRLAASATATTTPWRKPSSACSSRSHPPAGTVEDRRCRRMGNPEMVRLVQQPPPAAAHRKHHASRSRGEVL